MGEIAHGREKGKNLEKLYWTEKNSRHPQECNRLLSACKHVNSAPLRPPLRSDGEISKNDCACANIATRVTTTTVKLCRVSRSYIHTQLAHTKKRERTNDAFFLLLFNEAYRRCVCVSKLYPIVIGQSRQCAAAAAAACDIHGRWRRRHEREIERTIVDSLYGKRWTSFAM